MRVIILFTISVFLTVIFNFIGSSIIESKKSEMENKTEISYNTVEVIEVGQCTKIRCVYKIKNPEGVVYIGTGPEPVMLGQTMYQKCHTSKAKGKKCDAGYYVTRN